MEFKEAKGARVPALGFGTWELRGAACREAVDHALELGYRHIDTARNYGNESAVGAAVSASGLPREDLFITTKVWHSDLAGEDVRRSVHDSLEELRLDYVDLLLVHWPSKTVPLAETLDAMNGLREEGLIRNIGVSNFPPTLLCKAAELAPIVCNQVEYHVFLGQRRLLEVAAEEEVLVTAYAPLAKGDLVNHHVLEEIGRNYGKNASQVALRWLIQQPRVLAIPRSSSPEHREKNIAIFDFELSRDEMGLIDALPKDERHFNPEWAPVWED